MEINNKYIINIFEKYKDLKNSHKLEFTNNDLSKIFEYYSCIKLSQEYEKPFFEYNDIDPTFKEINKMSRNDTGIDCSDLENTIVQCKLRKTTLTWKECSTFFGSQNIFSQELNKPIVRWNNLIITRNDDCSLADNLLVRKELFIDKSYNKNELLQFCDNLIENPPEYPIDINNDFKLRDYQIESINMITENNKNVIICLPTGTGKNSVIIHSFQKDKKYLILVPRIILMEQLKEEIIKHKPKLKNKIQLIGDSNNDFNINKDITISTFNSVSIIENYCYLFEKIFIDEAHHINKPMIYYYEDYYNDDNDDNDEETIEEVKENIENKDILEDNLEDEEEDNLENNGNEDDEDYIEDEFQDNEDYTDDDYYSDEDFEDEDMKDNVEDELVDVKNYTKIIESLVKYNNNVYLSATIDKCDGFEYYSKDIREMIDLGYLCDYIIHIPIFTEDPDNVKTCKHLLENYRNIIIYCNSQKEGNEVNKLMNKLQKNSSQYIDCKTPKKKRNDIINKYKNGEIPFLVNVRILVEGFDAPITKGVCFLHLPNNKTTLIQIIGRALRLHNNKTIANIILPFSSKEDEKNISKFLKVMAQNDTRIKKSFENKQLGGYISINCINEENKENNDDEEDEDNEIEIEFKYNMIYNSMGVLINNEEIWMKRLEEVKIYIDLNDKLPSYHDKIKNIKQLGRWLSHQIENYKYIKFNMKNQKIYDKWNDFINDEKYKKYFISFKEKWLINFEEIKNYIDINDNILLYQYNKKLYSWLSHQIENYKNIKNIMKNKKIYNKWTEFINNEKYKKYFISNEEKWLINLKKLKEYIDINNKKPYSQNKNKDIKKIGFWMQRQHNIFKTKNNIMKNEEIYDKWKEFINDNKYKKYFLTNEELWLINLKKLKEYIDINNKKPSHCDKNIDIKHLRNWIGDQTKNYKNIKNIMKEKEIYNKWEEFINDEKYKTYF